MSETDPHFALKERRRERAVKAIHNVLTLEDANNFFALPCVLARLLGEKELVALGFAVLRALPYEVAIECAEAAIGPNEMPSFPDDEGYAFAARSWADSANEKELRAYAHAAIVKMAPRSRARLKDWLLSKMGGAK